jgi:hypothetical protein
MKHTEIESSWFFSEASLPVKLLLIFVRGDAIVLIPFLAVLMVTGIFSLRWMLLLISLYIVFRFLGEMVYWIHQQFGDRTYRPYDFGLKRLDNNAIYVIYQLLSLIWLVMGAGLFMGILLRWFIPSNP